VKRGVTSTEDVTERVSGPPFAVRRRRCRWRGKWTKGLRFGRVLREEQVDTLDWARRGDRDQRDTPEPGGVLVP
jgi:hypothetical protein